MMPVIRLIRIPNLLIIALTMYLFRYCLIGKMLDLRGVWLGLSDTDFLLLTLSVIVIAAAGYIINDYFDVSIDAVNKPEKVIIGRHISPDTAFRIYVALNVLGIIAGFYLALKVGNYKLGFINLLSAGLLWFYSSLYKKKFLLGNLVIAFLSALVPLIVAFFEPMREYASFGFIKAYAAFAFLMTLVREIIKDIEDIEGDKAEGATTMPVYIGIIPSKIIAVFLSLLMLLFLGYVEYQQFLTNDMLSFWYFVLGISLPLFLLCILVFPAKRKESFHKLSTLCKLIMVSGVLSTLIFYYSF